MDSRFLVRITYDNPAIREWTEEQTVYAPDELTAVAVAQSKHVGHFHSIRRATVTTPEAHDAD